MVRTAANLIVLVSFALAARAEDGVAGLSLSEKARHLLQQRGASYDGYGGEVEGETAYADEGPADYSAHYQQAAQAAIPKVVTELRLACSCSLKIPCFDMRTSECVPTVCGSNSRASFVDNRIPRYSHPTYDDDTANSTDYDGYRSLSEYDSGVTDADLSGPTYSNPVIGGCKCPSGTTRCYQCAEIGRNTKIFMWVLFVFFAALAYCCIRLVQTDPLPPTAKNQEAQAICGAMYFIFALAALSYMCLAVDWGYTVRSWDLRHVYFSRYFDWLVATNIMVYTAAWFAMAPKAYTLFLVLLDTTMIFFGFIGALVHSNVKWLFFFLAFLAYVMIVVILHSLKLKVQDLKRSSISLVLKWIITLTFVLYPIVWILAEGIGHLCASTEATLYGLLDLFTKLLFCGTVALARPFLTDGLNLAES